MATGGLTTTPSLDWLWIASKAIFAGSPDFGSTPNLSLTRLLALDRPKLSLQSLLALDQLQSYLSRLSWPWIASKAIFAGSLWNCAGERLVPAGNRYHRDKSTYSISPPCGMTEALRKAGEPGG